MMRRRSDLPPADPQPWSEMIPTDSFYARLAKWRDVLVEDEDYAPLYKDSPRGRPSIPPSMVVLAMLLEYHDDCSDAEAEQKMRFDLRWKHALGLGLDEAGFDATVLCRFRRELLERGLERNLFERLVEAAREAGLIAKDATQLLDSSHILEAAGARDTYTLIRSAIRKLLRTLGHTTANSSGTLVERLWWYMDPRLQRNQTSIGVSRRRASAISKRSSVTGDRRFRWHKVQQARVPRRMQPPRCSLRSSPTTSRKARHRHRSARLAHPRKGLKRSSGRRPRDTTLPQPTNSLVRGCAGEWRRIASLAWSIPRCALVISPSARRGRDTRFT